MAIAFVPGGDRLPAGRHDATVAEIEALLVDGFPNSVRRRPLFESWQRVIGAIQRLVPIEEHWIDGSFVTTKPEPVDIDVLTVFDGQALDALDPIDRTLLIGLVRNKISQALHGCDSYFIAKYPDGHPSRPQYDTARAYWDDWFGRARDGNPKGYVGVVLA